MKDCRRGLRTVFVYLSSLLAGCVLLLGCAGGTSSNASGSGSSGSTGTPSSPTVTATQITIKQAANDLVADPVRGVIYATVPDLATANADSILTIDPTTGSITKVTAAGSNPDHIAISDDGAYLYVGSDGDHSVRRYILPAMTLDFTVSLANPASTGTQYAMSLDVAPGAPNTWAVSTGIEATGVSLSRGLQIYDGPVPRGAQLVVSSGINVYALDTIAWGKDATVLYGVDTETTGRELCVFPITSTGIGQFTIYQNAFIFIGHNEMIHFDKTIGLLYADDGESVDPATGKPGVGFASSGALTTDGNLGRAYSLEFEAIGLEYLQSFDISTGNSLSLAKLQLSLPPVRIVRWGVNGLAFNTLALGTFTSTGTITFYTGSLVK